MKKIALVHDWLVTDAGSEKVLKVLAEITTAPIFTLFYRDLSSFSEQKIRTTFLQKLPKIDQYYRFLLPLFPLAIRRFDLSDYDFILSSSHCVAKSVKTSKKQKHICYCHTPMRYIWEPRIMGLSSFKQKLFYPLFSMLRKFDRHFSKEVDLFIANSTCVQKRIEKYYHRSAQVIFPPVDTQRFFLASQRKDYYFTSCRHVGYKRVDLLLGAFQRLPGQELIIAGDGPLRKKWERMASSNVSFRGMLPEDEYRKMLREAKAFLHAGEEDFGITLAEASASGVPIIAYGKGGSEDIVIPNETGILFPSQTQESILEAIEIFERMQFDPKRIKESAQRFSKERFIREIEAIIQNAY